MTDIAWTSWGPERAEGTGTEHRVICQPNCAAGHEITFGSHITLRKATDPGPYFSEVVVTDENGNPEVWPRIAPR
ncbi:hypothetical protein [Nocardia sp. NBC_00511]|uniref:hypothetical protein n=1 Tax=Nocardia sp. NBC_00511 TaxID=2903591 RepID=UPI0030E0490F